MNDSSTKIFYSITPNILRCVAYMLLMIIITISSVSAQNMSKIGDGGSNQLLEDLPQSPVIKAVLPALDFSEFHIQAPDYQNKSVPSQPARNSHIIPVSDGAGFGQFRRGCTKCQAPRRLRR